MMADIDIDFQTTFDPLKIFNSAIPASVIKDGEITKHQCGVYFQNMPVDLVSGFAAIPYKSAEELGYFKVDMLHLTILDNFSSKDEIRKLLNKQPNWELLEYPQQVEKLFQISKHFETIIKIKPKSIQELADCIALIRPGKKHLLYEYLKNRKGVRPQLYTKPENDGYYYKKSHAISYAMTIVLQLHLIEQGKL